MQTPTRFMGLAFVFIFLLFSPTASAETLWEGDVFAWSNTDDPAFVETIHVDTGTTLSISATLDDEWRLWAEDDPYWPLSKTINANGYPGIQIDGLPIGGLVGKIGETGDLFFIGTDFYEEITETGTLYLACWDFSGMYGDNDDAIHVIISDQDEFSPADFDHDNDVDGADLALYIGDPTALELSEFALAFGTFEKTDNGNLSDLTVSAGTLIPSFSAQSAHYIVKVDNRTAEIYITPELEDPLASLTINDTEAPSGVPFPVSLETGGNFISIEVTSQDGSVVKGYSIIAVRTGMAALSALTFTSYDLNPAFSPDTDVYDIAVEDGVDVVEITAETDDPTSLITINGIGVTSGSAFFFPIVEGNNEMEIDVTATDGSDKRYYVFVRKTGTAAETVYVVDEAHAPDQFETLTGAVNHLNGSLASGQVGEIRIQTTEPMEVDALTISADMFIIVEPGASNVISGPSGMPLVIDALGGWNISGLSFTNSPGYAINTSRGLSMLGSSFSGDTVINISGSSGLYARADWSYAKGFEFGRGNVNGQLNLNLSGDTDADFNTVGTKAMGITFDASGALVGNARLMFEANATPGLNVRAKLKDNATAEFTGHGGLGLLNTGIAMEGNASALFKNNLVGRLEVECLGLMGQIGFENVTAANANLDLNMDESTFTGSANTYTNFSMNVGYSNNITSFGFTEKGGHALLKYQLFAENASIDAQVFLAFDDMDFGGNVNLFAGGQATVTANNGTVFKAETVVKFSGSIADLTIADVTAEAKFSVFLPDSNMQFYIQAQKSKFDTGAIFNTATDQVSGKMEDIFILSGGVIFLYDTGGISTPDAGDNPSLAAGSAIGVPEAEDAELIFDNLTITSTDEPGIYIEGIGVPVTIQNSTIDGGIWAIDCVNVDADVTIANNTNLTGGIRFDGDPYLAGNMIDRQYTVSGNTITQNYPGGGCLSSHAIRNITASNNTMTAGTGAHGILLNGGKMLVDGGSIVTSGPVGSTAIGLGASAGGANAVLYADNVNPITGLILPSLQGYVKLTNNTFSNALVVDLGEQPRLLNDPVSDNTGLDPDGDVLGSLIDWNDDDHNCPDYPTRCDEWDEDLNQCGCGHYGIDPPSEPAI